MKRSQTSSRAMRRRTTNDAASTGKKSRYARKLDAGRQLYGGRGAASCCAHNKPIKTYPRSEKRGGQPANGFRDLFD